MNMLVAFMSIGFIGIITLALGYISNLQGVIKKNRSQSEFDNLSLILKDDQINVLEEVLKDIKSQTLRNMLYGSDPQYIFFNNNTGELTINPKHTNGFDYIGIL